MRRALGLLSIVLIFPGVYGDLKAYNQLLRETQRQFQGRWVTVGVKVDNGEPFSKIVANLDKGVEARYGGISVEQMKRLREYFGFSIRWYDMPKNATPDVLVEGVGNGTFPVDILPYIFTVNAPREDGARLSLSPYDFTLAVVTKVPPSRLNTGGLVDIFSPLVWVFLVLSIFVLALLRFWVDAERNPDLFDLDKRRQYFNSLVSTVSIFAQQEVHPPLTSSGHLLVVGTKIFALCFVGLFLAQVLGLTNRLSGGQVNSGTPGGKVSVQLGSALVGTAEWDLGFTKESKPEEWKKAVKPCKSVEACFQMVADGEVDYTYVPNSSFWVYSGVPVLRGLVEEGVYDLPFAEAIVGGSYCGILSVSDSALLKQNSAWVFPKTGKGDPEGVNTLADLFDTAISLMRDKAELFDVAEKSLKPVRDKCASILEDRTLQDPITVIEVFILWVMLATLILIVTGLGIANYRKSKDNPDAPIDANRRRHLLHKVNRNSLNFGLNRAERRELLFLMILDDNTVSDRQEQQESRQDTHKRSPSDSSGNSSSNSKPFNSGRGAIAWIE